MKSFNRILLTSTSEVYGDPLVHPQPESYWGNVNPIGEFSSSLFSLSLYFAGPIELGSFRRDLPKHMLLVNLMSIL